MSDTRITTDEWLAAWQAAASEEPRGTDSRWSTSELAQAWRCSIAVARKRLKIMKAAGLARGAGTRYEEGLLDDRKHPVPVFELVRP